MEPNVGGYDRIARIVGGLVLLGLGVAGYAGEAQLAVGPVPQVAASVIVAVVGVAILATGVFSRCLINEALGRSTATGSR